MPKGGVGERERECKHQLRIICKSYTVGYHLQGRLHQRFSWMLCDAKRGVRERLDYTFVNFHLHCVVKLQETVVCQGEQLKGIYYTHT